MTRLVLLLTLCWLLSASVGAKPAVRPSPSPSPTPNPALQLTDPANPPGAAHPGDPGALTLQQTVDVGLAKNPSMKSAAERVSTAVAQYDQAQSQKNLKLSFSDSTQFRAQGPVSVSTAPILGDQIAPGFPSTFTLINTVQSQIEMALQLLLTTFGRVENQIAAAFLNIDAQAKNADIDRRNLIYSVKQSFYNQLKSLAGEDAARLNLLVAEQSLSDTDAQFNQGLLAKYDVVQAQLQVVQATQQLQQRKTEILTTAANVRTLLVMPQDERVALIPPPPIVIDEAVTVKGLEGLALMNRPEIQSLDRQLAVAEALKQAAEADSAPTVGMGLGYRTSPGNEFAPNNLVVLQFNVSWYLWDGGLAHAKTAQAESSIRNIVAQAEQIKLQVLFDVQAAWLAYQQTQFDVDTAVKRVETASVYYDMARQRFNVGLATSLEVQQAVKALNDARVDQVVSTYNRDLAFAQLEQALGTDFPDRHVTLASLTQPATGGDWKR